MASLWSYQAILLKIAGLKVGGCGTDQGGPTQTLADVSSLLNRFCALDGGIMDLGIDGIPCRFHYHLLLQSTGLFHL